MRILGINDGYIATACLIENGEVVGMASEERFNRQKNFSGFPLLSARWLLEDKGLAAGDIDAVAVAGRSASIDANRPFHTGRHALLAGLSGVLPGLASNDRVIKTGVEWLARKRHARFDWSSMESLGLQKHPISFYDHHSCHTAAAYYGSGFRDVHQQTLVITYDGSGDGLCSTVRLLSEGKTTLVHTINSYHSLALLYSRITQHLGMKPLEHEYKVMGMAPYCDSARGEAIRDILQGYVQPTSDGLSMKNVSRSWGDSMLDRLFRDLRGMRFDWVAGGVQLHFEETMMKYVLAWVRKTGVRNVVLSGGAFMNVKLNMLLQQSEEIHNMYVLPSCGDESIALGCCYLKTEELEPGCTKPLTHLYFGNRCSEPEIQAALETGRDRLGVRRCDDIEKETAKLLADQKIIGRCRGRMEWGARALGNRSILAHPGSMQTIHRINKAIKMRDFWMPFCPSVLFERRGLYFENPRDVDAPYMILAFPATERAEQHIPATLHPFDRTGRPQFVTKEWNPRYHRLISEFEALTGIGGVLNTSFNLHGYPIVSSASDCIDTLLRSDIDYLTLEDYLVWRNG